MPRKTTPPVAWRTLGIASDKLNKPLRFSDWETHQTADHDADVCFENSLRVLTEAEIDMERARTLREWARYKIQKGEKQQGQAMWQEAKELFAKIGAQPEVDRMNELPA